MQGGFFLCLILFGWKTSSVLSIKSYKSCTQSFNLSTFVTTMQLKKNEKSDLNVINVLIPHKKKPFFACEMKHKVFSFAFSISIKSDFFFQEKYKNCNFFSPMCLITLSVQHFKFLLVTSMRQQTPFCWPVVSLG